MAGASTGVMSSLVWKETITLMKLLELDSLMKCYKCMVQEGTNEHNKYHVDDHSHHQRRTTNYKRNQRFWLMHGIFLNLTTLTHSA